MLKVVLFGWLIFISPNVSSETNAKVMVLDFQLNDLTDLPNAPEELARIAYLSTIFKQKIADSGISVISANDQLKRELPTNSATYLFDQPALAAKLAEDSGADFLIMGVALKPTYLFVYPRVLVVDIKTRKVIYATYSQLESSWLDKNTTMRTANMLADRVNDKLKELDVNSQLE
ncbi:MAG: DUF2380 domain-containing protein [Methylophilaceae bacterium]